MPTDDPPTDDPPTDDPPTDDPPTDDPPNDDPLSPAIQFLNSLENDTAIAFMNEVLVKSKLSPYINPEKLKNISVDQLRALNGPGKYTGTYLLLPSC